jgi:predicted nuclease of predicted toxin-antitoxin system
MTLLFDHHLSRKLVGRLVDRFPGSSHVVLHGLERADDVVIWSFARTNGFTIVTKDADFNDMSTLRGAPPKIIWIRIGNCTTATIEHFIRTYATEIEQFITQSPESLLEIIPNA